MDELRILSPTAILGYGFPADFLARGMSRRPHAIAVDAGSTDPGPHYLGMQTGEEGGDPAQFARTLESDLRPLVKAALEARIPLLAGSAGMAGGNLHLMSLANVAKDIAQQERLKFRMAS